MMKQPGLTFIGGSVVRVAAVTMTPIPKCGSIFDAVRQIDTFYIEAHARAECSELDSIATFISEYILFVFSNSPDVSAEQDGHEFSVLGATNQARGTATVYVYKDHLKQYLDLQDSIYVAAYNVGGSGWVDPLTERTFYTSWNAKRDRTLAIKWIEE